MDLFKKVEKFVLDSFANSQEKNGDLHHQRTVYWIKQLKSDADGALLIAGMAHDIERAFNGDWKRGSMDPVALRKHQDMSAVEIERFLQEEGAKSARIFLGAFSDLS